MGGIIIIGCRVVVGVGGGQHGIEGIKFIMGGKTGRVGDDGAVAEGSANGRSLFPSLNNPT